MSTNYNNPHGAFAPMSGEQDSRYISASFVNQDGSTTTDPNAQCDTSCSFFDTTFAGNLGTALGTVGAAYFGKKAPSQSAPPPAAPKPQPTPASSNTGMYWTIGIVATVVIIGGIVYAVKRRG